jgi:prepilin-type N-terminal cleavage/methylation domain-containing protein
MKPGFTLSELLVTLAVLAVLAGVAVPVTGTIRNRAHAASCLGNLRAIGAGLESYVQDHHGRLPELDAARYSRTQDRPVLETVLLPYVGGAGNFHCPADKHQFRKTGSSYAWNSTQSGARVTNLRFFGFDRPEMIPLASDKEAWHDGAVHFLYANSSTSGDARFATGKR